MTSPNDHLFSHKEVLNCLKTALSKTTPTLPYKKIENFKLRDFELLEKALISYFRSFPELNINVPAAGALYNLALKGESKRSKAMAAIAFYILHKDKAFNDEELKQLKNNSTESLLSNYTNRLIILNKYRDYIDAQKINIFKKQTPFYKLPRIILSLVLIALSFLLYKYFSNSEPVWNLYSEESNTDHLFKLWVDYEIDKKKIKSTFLKFSDNNKRKIENSKGTISFKTPYFHINKVDLFIDNKKYTKSIINPSNGWKARINSVFINDPAITETGKVLIPDALQKNTEDKNLGEFFRVENFDVPLDQIHFQTKILDSHQRNDCSDNISIELNGFNGSEITSLSFTLVPSGCETHAQINVGEVFLTHSNYNLKKLEIEDRYWKDLTVKTSNKNLEIYYGKEMIAKIPYNQDLGLLKTIQFKFEEAISVDYFRLFDSSGKMIIDDNF